MLLRIFRNLSLLVKTLVGNRTSQSHISQTPTELPKLQSVESKEVPLHFWFSRVFQKSVGEEQSIASVSCETYETNLQSESHRMKQDFGTPIDGPVILLGAIHDNPIST